MKRILFMLGMNRHQSEVLPMPESTIDEELVRLTRRVPRTTAEKQFHAWLLAWKKE
jgi:hypothetical protein